MNRDNITKLKFCGGSSVSRPLLQNGKANKTLESSTFIVKSQRSKVLLIKMYLYFQQLVNGEDENISSKKIQATTAFQFMTSEYTAYNSL